MFANVELTDKAIALVGVLLGSLSGVIAVLYAELVRRHESSRAELQRSRDDYRSVVYELLELLDRAARGAGAAGPGPGVDGAAGPESSIREVGAHRSPHTRNEVLNELRDIRGRINRIVGVVPIVATSAGG